MSHSSFGYSHSFRLLLLLSVLGSSLSEPASSLHDLVLVLPFNPLCEDTTVSSSLMRVSGLLVEPVRGLELSSVMCVAISNHNLGGVLVGHDDSRLR